MKESQRALFITISLKNPYDELKPHLVQSRPVFLELKTSKRKMAKAEFSLSLSPPLFLFLSLSRGVRTTKTCPGEFRNVNA